MQTNNIVVYTKIMIRVKKLNSISRRPALWRIVNTYLERDVDIM
jgi:hypothetical protein